MIKQSVLVRGVRSSLVSDFGVDIVISSQKKLSAEVTNVQCPPLLEGSQAEPALQNVFLVTASSTAP